MKKCDTGQAILTCSKYQLEARTFYDREVPVQHMPGFHTVSHSTPVS